ncbi:hypothetical protein D3C76_1496190 [compost metagenome]
MPLYTSYPVTPTLSDEALQLRLTLDEVLAVTVTLPGAVGAVVSPGFVPGSVVTESGALACETLPAASRATTVKLYAVAGAKPLIVTVVPDTLAACVPFR